MNYYATYRAKASPYEIPSYESGTAQYAPLTEDPATMLKLSWVYACIRIISETGKRVPLDVFIGDSPQPRHPLAKLLKRPNPFMSGPQLIEGTLAWLEIHGNAYWLLDELQGAKPGKIWLLDSTNIEIVPDSQLFIRSYILNVNGTQRVIDPGQIIHFKRFNPFNMYYGLGTLQAIGDTVETELFRQMFDKQFFKNGAVVKGVLSFKDPLDENTKKRIAAEWRKMHAGIKNSFKTALLDNGATYQQISMSQKDMEMPELARQSRDKILAAFGVPPSKLGLVEDANRANSAEQDKTFLSETMAPKLMDIEEKINAELAPRFGGNVEVRFEELNAEDETEKIQRVALLAPLGILTTDELREMIGYEKRGQNSPDTAPEMNGQGDSTSGQDNGAQKAVKSLLDTFERSRIAYLAIKQKKFTPIISKFFAEQEKRVLTRLEHVQKGLKTFTLADLWDDAEENAELKNLLMPVFLEVATDAYKKAGVFLDKDIRFSMDNAEHRDIILKLASKVTRINETTKKQLREVIREGLLNGYSIYQIAHGDEEKGYKGIGGVFEQAKGSRAETIARSETADAYNAADCRAYRDLGQSKVHVLDGVDYDEDCRQANGQIWPIEKAEENLKAHPRCTRAFAPYVELGKGVEEWAKKAEKRIMELDAKLWGILN